MIKTCTECGGRGFWTKIGIGDNMDVDDEICDYCNGKGRIEIIKEIPDEEGR